MEVVKNELGLSHVEMVADNDFGPAFYLREPEAFREYHRNVASEARRLGVQIRCVVTVYETYRLGPPPATRRRLRRSGEWRAG